MAPSDAKRRGNLLRLGLIVGLAAVVVIVAIVLSSGGGNDETSAPTGSGSTAPDAAALYRGIPQSGVTLGDPKTKVTLIEFADLQCPFCAEYATQAMPTVIQRYVRAGELRYELRIRAFLGDDSVRAAGAAAAATKQNRLFQFADVFYHRQGAENSGYVTDEFITDVARDAGVDPAAAVAAAKDGANQPLLRQAEQKASSIGSNSTPDFFLQLAGGRLVPVQPQALSAEAFTEALDQALAQA